MFLAHPEHQMNLEFKSVFGATRPTLPLQEGGNIVCGNATREDWEEVCPKDEGNEVYILGNPPYLGGKFQTKDQKRDLEIDFRKLILIFSNIAYSSFQISNHII